MDIYNELIINLFNGQNPYDIYDEKYIDNGYPHTNIIPTLLSVLFTTISPSYITECGSMLGGSAIVMANILKTLSIESKIVCIDPFTGDVNMWDWEATIKGGWRFLRLENGFPTIHKRFIANCHSNGFKDTILPINATTSVGIKLLQRLLTQGRISALPNYIYLDSAHEKNETFVELSICWNALSKNSVLFGDDWFWEAVQNDVIKFAETIKNQINTVVLETIRNKLPEASIINDSILLYNGQWVLFK